MADDAAAGIILAALSTLTGWAVLKFNTFEDFLAPSVSTPGYLGPARNPSMEHPLGYGLLVAILVVIIACYFVYRATARTMN